MRTLRVFAVGAMLLSISVAGCKAGTSSPPNAWVATRDTIVEEYLKAHPVFAVGAGRHEYDGQLPDWTASGIAAEIKRLKEWRARLAAVQGFEPARENPFHRHHLPSPHTP